MRVSTALLALLVPSALALVVRDEEFKLPDLTKEIEALQSVTNSSAPKLVYAEATRGGLWEVFDDESKPLLSESIEARGDLHKRCGSNQVWCDYQYNRARAGVCGFLLDALGAPENRGRSLTLHTSQCFTAVDISDNNKCCISWSRRVDGVVVHQLFNAAVATLDTCKRDGLVSGAALDVDLNGHCVNQCLSDRDNGCGDG